MSEPVVQQPSRRVRKRLEKLDHIARTGFGLFEAHGYDAVTMEQLAAEADVAKGTLYSHFPVKEAVLAHWIHMQLEHDLARLLPMSQADNNFKRGMRRLLDASATWHQKHREYLLPYLRYRFLSVGQPEPEENDARADLVRAFMSLIEAAQRSGELRDSQPAARLALFFHFLYLAALMRWLMTPKAKLREEFAAALEVFLKGSSRGGTAARKHS
ncbi:MAG TPA: TetR/AcrR family transcriptional regulator [Steroidobacter sp.]|uniref:TetR/AcrR family transcriptional regulator n=1 Tax=Steroidobacter sp. TaxID=1978227 RepID=UPI002ED80DFD